MNVTIPVYIEEQRTEGAPVPVYVARALFTPWLEARDENLTRAMAKLAKALRRALHRMGKERRHEALAAENFCPALEDHLMTFTLDLGSRRVPCHFLLVTFESLGRRLAFTPSRMDLWFEVESGESLHERAAEVLTRYFRDQIREGEPDDAKPEDLSVKGKAWVTTVDLDIQPPLSFERSEKEELALLEDSAVMDGETELLRVGECLNWSYPDDLDRAIGRDRELEELTRLLRARDQRPVLLIGPRRVGKTALIHEYVYRTVAEQKSQFSSRRQVWWLSPQRIISGMSYVGQWENRLLAILKEAKRCRHILYFDHLLGLFRAGITSRSGLSVAHVLKPYVERRDFRMLAEITPEAFGVLQEKDRGFADLFHLIPIKEPDETETLQILIRVMQQLEGQHGSRFDKEALAAAVDLQRRFVRDAAFPGKAAVFLRQLAVKYRHRPVTRAEVLEEFHAKSGLAVAFLNQDLKLERPAILEALGREVIGQDAVLQAAADVISIAKARLNDPDRPLAAFLFLGPTGVGKTQCARSLAAYLFDDAEQIIRFDMNEFVSPSAAARLVGTFDQPEGLLTGAVRRQPFSVVLLDEIEKSHPDVFDLLLQVMGEGRLTDALGRTVDFSQTFLILTSNLGVKEASGELGFRPGELSESSIYRQAAERFFRPEFINRLDRIVPFERLRREDVRRIAERLIQEVFAREGLLRRQCILHIDERAMEDIIDQGYHPLLGARALKRAIERQLTQPVAARLVTIPVEMPTVVNLYREGTELAVHVQGVTAVAVTEARPGLAELGDAEAVLERVEAMAHRVERAAEALRPAGDVALDEVSPAWAHYFAVKEQVRRLRNMHRRAGEWLSKARRSPALATKFFKRGQSRRLIARRITDDQDGRSLWQEIVAARDIRDYLREWIARGSPYGLRLEEYLADLLREAALLQTLAESRPAAGEASVALHVQAFSHTPPTAHVQPLHALYEEFFGQEMGLEVTAEKTQSHAVESLFIQGRPARALARLEEGTHLFCAPDGRYDLVRVSVRPGGPPSTGDEVPFALPPVVRIYDMLIGTLDLRSELMTPAIPSAAELRAFLLTALPLPKEFNSSGKDS